MATSIFITSAGFRLTFSMSTLVELYYLITYLQGVYGHVLLKKKLVRKHEAPTGFRNRGKNQYVLENPF